MDREDVNTLILDQVDDIGDDRIRGFIDDILRFERSELNKDRPHYKSPYNEYLDDYIDEWENHELGD